MIIMKVTASDTVDRDRHSYPFPRRSAALQDQEVALTAIPLRRSRSSVDCCQDLVVCLVHVVAVIRLRNGLVHGAEDHVGLAGDEDAAARRSVVYSAIFARFSSWRMPTAGMPRPAWRILSKARFEHSFVAASAPSITRTWPSVVAVDAVAGADRAASLHSPSPSQSMHVSAVKVSFTAGDSARMAISTSWSIANVEILGQRPVRARWRAARVERSADRRPAAAAGQTHRRAGGPATTKWPGRWSSRITASAARCDLDESSVADRPAGSHSRGRGRRRRPRRSERAARLSDETGVAVVGARHRVVAELGRRSPRPRSRAMLAIDLGELDRLRDVVDEVDEHAEVDAASAPSATVTERCGTKSPRSPRRHGAEREDAVHERRDEDARVSPGCRGRG